MIVEKKKYIIELPENTYWIQWIMESTKDHHPFMDYKQAEDLTPYTEPDTESIRREAYEAGAKSSAIAIADDKAHEAYQRGLSDAWEAARKIAVDADHGGLPAEALRKIFSIGIVNIANIAHIFDNFFASEVIEKIRQYEQEKQFHVGDEFENESGKRFVITKMDGTEIDRYIDEEGKTYCMIAKYKVMRKTGRHFPEIVEVLQKMKEKEWT